MIQDRRPGKTLTRECRPGPFARARRDARQATWEDFNGYQQLISNKIISALLAAFAILIVTCVVLMAFQALLGALHDTLAARTLQWIGIGCIILLVTDILLLVGALSVRALEQDRRRSNDP